jgi:hypothetical protein
VISSLFTVCLPFVCLVICLPACLTVVYYAAFCCVADDRMHSLHAYRFHPTTVCLSVDLLSICQLSTVFYLLSSVYCLHLPPASQLRCCFRLQNLSPYAQEQIEQVRPGFFRWCRPTLAGTLQSAVCCVLSAVCRLLSVVCCVPSAVCCLLSAVCCLPSIVRLLLSASTCLMTVVCCLA